MADRLPQKPSQSKILSFVVAFLFSAPLLYYWIYAIWVSPSQNFYTNDAEFPYFMNSLAVFKGGTYTYIDHPGTPLEEIGTAILSISYPLIGKDRQEFILYHLQNPDIFLHTVHDFLIFSNLLCIVVFYWIGLKTLGQDNAIVAAALALMYFAVHPLSLNTTTIWNHNSFNFPFGTLLLLFFFTVMNQESSQGRITGKSLILLGLFSGILAAVTIYMTAWVIGIIIGICIFYRLQSLSWLKTIGAIFITFFAGIVGFLLVNLPIIDRLVRFWNWINSILTHQSKYLAVSRDEPSLVRIFNNLGVLYNILPVLLISTVVVMGLALATIIIWRKKLFERPGLWAALIALSFQVVTLLIIFLDRPLREAYLLSLAATLPVLSMAILAIWEYSPRARSFMNISLSLLVFAGVINTSTQSIRIRQEEISSFSISQAQAANSIADYAKATGRSEQELTILWMYGTYSKCWGLRAGDSLSRNIFIKEVNAICPREYYLGNNLRADINGNFIPLSEINWDVIFTCEKGLKDIAVPGTSSRIEKYSQIQWGCGSMVVVLNK